MLFDGKLFDPDAIGDETPIQRWTRYGTLLLFSVPTTWGTTSLLTVVVALALENVGFFGFSSLGSVIGLAAALASFCGALLYVGIGVLMPLFTGMLYLWTEVLVFLVLPLWGFGINAFLPDCTHACESQYEAIAAPGIASIALAWGIALLAWTVARVRPQPLPTWSEIPVLGGLLLGAVTCMILTVQFGPLVAAGAVFGPVGFPLVAPPLAGLAITWMIVRRLRRIGRPLVGPGAFSLVAAWYGLDALVGRLVLDVSSPTVAGLTQTCGWTLSQMQPPPGDCHYLCTVAAQGHPWLVRPQRLGRRRGRVIVVNRQLAVANAFEDLLHERWPRFGRWARSTYDRVGRPISHRLLHPLAADAVFLAMIPAQWAFSLFLLLFDPGEPEARIDRMYR